MTNYKKTVFCIAMCCAFMTSVAQDAHRTVSKSMYPTRYDWSGVANSITSPSKPNIEKARDIFNWLCRNIAYDTTYSIYSADETYEKRRGVCNGYSELFIRLADAVGLKADKVSGYSKDDRNKINPDGHAWIFAYINGSTGILIDPTWGAGTVNNGVFKRSPQPDLSWFHVDPEWMIMSHWPDNASYQLLERPLSRREFEALPPLDPDYKALNCDPAQIIAQSLAGNQPELVKIYPTYLKKMKIQKVPVERNLRVGNEYTFQLGASNHEYALIENGEFNYGWQNSGSGSIRLSHIPQAAGTLKISVKDTDGSWYAALKYEIAEPTAEDIRRLESKYPLLSPRLQECSNYDRQTLEYLQVDGASLLYAVKRQHIRALPQLYSKVKFRPIDIPWNRDLQSGRTYYFVFEPGSGKKWAVINNGKWTYGNVDPKTGQCRIVVTPEAGELKLSAALESEGSFWGAAVYRVK